MSILNRKRKQVAFHRLTPRVEYLEDRIALAVNPFQQMFDINPAESTLTLGVDFVLVNPPNPDVLLGTLLEQSLGSLQTELDGTLLVGSTNGTNITLYNGSKIEALDQAGPFDPGAAPADFAGTFLFLGALDIDAAIRGFIASVGTATGSIAINNSFTIDDLPLTTTSATLDYSISGAPDSSDFSGTSAPWDAAGTLGVSSGNVTSITIPIDALAQSFTDISGLTIRLDITFTGTIKAYASNTPSVNVTGLQDVVQGEPVNYTFSAFDNAWGTSQSYTYDIDWNGDSTYDQTVVGGDSVVVQHVYPTSGTNNIIARITDPAALQGVRPPYEVAVSQHLLRANGGLTDLIWGGTTGADQQLIQTNAGNIEAYDLTSGLIGSPISGVTGKVVAYMQGGDDLLVTNFLNGASLDGGDGNDALAPLDTTGGDYTLNGGAGNDLLYFVNGTGFDVTMLGGEGDDELFLMEGTTVSLNMQGGNGFDAIVIVGGSGVTATIDGGGDDDTILTLTDQPTVMTVSGGGGDDFILAGVGADSIDGGTGSDLLIGGVIPGADGNDTVNGGDGNDVIVGHEGADSLSGGNGEDLVLAGSVDLIYFGEEDYPGIVQVWDQWRTADPIATRIAYLTGTSGGIIDPMFTMTPGSTILDDSSVDSVLGNSNSDWLIYDFTTDASDYSAGTDSRTNL